MKRDSLNLIRFNLVFMGALLQANISHAELDAHVHGLSNLALAIEENVIEMEFSSPAINLVGFEHQATTQQDIEMIKRAKLKLQQYNELYTFIGARCSIESSSINVSNILDDNPKNSNKTHEDKHHHEHSHNDESDTHSEVIANYRFSCKNLTTLKSIKVSLFEYFSSIDKVNAMWVTDEGQGSVILDKGKHTIDFR